MGLALETRKPVRIISEGVRQDFQGNVAAKLRIGGLIHLAHAALADLGRDLVVTESRTDCQGHGLY